MFYWIARLCLCLMFMASISGSAEAERRQLPDLSGYTLDGHRRSLPADLAAPVTLLIVTLENPGSEQTDAWRTMAGALGSDIPVLFVVLMDERGPRARAFAAGRLRGEVKAPAQRAQMIAVFSDVAEFYRLAGLSGLSDVAALLVSDDGRIIGNTRRADTQAAQTELAAALVVWQPQPGLAKDAVASPAPALSGSIPSYVQQSPQKDEQAAREDAAQSPAPQVASTPKVVASPLFPELSGYTLSGDRITLPDDVIPANTRLYILRRGGGASTVSADVDAIAESQGTDDNWLALVFMGKSPRPSKAFAAGSLRSEIGAAALRSHVVPVFSDIATLEDGLGLGLLTANPPICIRANGALCAPATVD
jgi:hypothetical protein